MDREAWWAAVHGVTKSRTRLRKWVGTRCSPPPYIHVNKLALPFGQWKWGQSWLKENTSHLYLHMYVSVPFITASQVVLVVRNRLPTQETRDGDSVPRSGRSPGGGHGTPLQSSCLENPMDRGAWRATVHRVAKSQTRLKQLSVHAHMVVLVLMWGTSILFTRVATTIYIPINIHKGFPFPHTLTNIS